MKDEMEDNYYLQNCGENDVLSFGTSMFKVSKLKEEVKNLLHEHKLGEQLSNSFSSQNLRIHIGGGSRENNYNPHYNKWFGDGISCEILKTGVEGWQKGKVKINLQVSLEFCPDEPEMEEIPASNELGISPPESPLDDLRRMIPKDT